MSLQPSASGLQPRLVLGIETSCDETAAGVASGAGLAAQVLANVVASQDALHGRFGGVVPEIASRAHLERLPAIVEEALGRAGIERPDAIAVTVGPGLVGALLVGVSYAQGLAGGWRVPLVPVHHLHAHLWVVAAAHGLAPPFGGLVISGGHTAFYWWPECASRPRFLGGTVDDAAGEAFDKVAMLMGLGYPGGPAIEEAAEGARDETPLPLAGAEMPGVSLSFSGLKTAVLYHLRGMNREPDAEDKKRLACSFQERAARTLALKTAEMLRMGETAGLPTGASSVVVGGGVAANRVVKRAISAACEEAGARAYFPPAGLAQDNGAMVALYGGYLLACRLESGVRRLKIEEQAKELPTAYSRRPPAFVPEPFARGKERVHGNRL